MQLNTDTTTRAQWSPSLSVNARGTVLISWYDERSTTNVDPSTQLPTLERFARASFDNGATWEPDSAISDVVFPVPLQPDPAVANTYVGGYNLAAFSSDGNVAYHTWADGRVSINSAPQQDVFFDRIVLTPPPVVVTTTDDHDDGTCNVADCTLREAINAVNSAIGDDSIAFVPGLTGTIQLTSALPSLSGNLTITGPGPGSMTVRRNSGGNYRIFTASNGSAAGPSVSISGLTITNGLAPSG
ncbi:MAG: CSLREA domain-containing protein, partial [Vicinamibacterales bacterium]